MKEYHDERTLEYDDWWIAAGRELVVMGSSCQGTHFLVIVRAA